MGYVMLLVLLALGVVVYFIPTFVANSRNHPNATAICVLNLLLGWSVIGWVAAMVWAFTQSLDQPAAKDSATRKCPYCAEEIRPEAIKCKHCGSEITAPSA